VRDEILAGRVRACHDVSDGGLLVALAEMAMEGDTGLDLLAPPEGILPHAFWFGEDQARYVVAVSDAEALLAAAAAAGVPARRLGRCAGPDLTLPGGVTISLEECRVVHEAFLPNWLQ
jgi:phosphoribosylformylglycinamidine synthase subunit PurL